MLAPTHTFAEPATPHPPRFRWLKRLSLAGFLLVGLLLSIRLWWGHHARRLLDIEIAAAHARGEPVLMEDFNRAERLADEENAAVLLQTAAWSINYNPAQTDFDNRFDWDLALTDADRALQAGIVIANTKALQLARQAVALPRADWNIRLTSPLPAVLLPHLNGQRGLADLLRTAAFHHHQTGDDALVMQDLTCLLRQVQAIDQQPAFLVNHLVAIGISEVGCGLTMRLAGDLKLIVSADASPAAGPATSAQVRTLIARLLDTRAYHQAAAMAWYGERVILTDDQSLLWFIAPSPAAPPWQPTAMWPIQPMLQLDALRMFRWETAIAHASTGSTFPAAKAKLPAKLPTLSPSPLRQMTSILRSAGWMGATGRSNVTHFRGLAERRMAAVLLAIRLYQLDHDGSSPPTLAALVPAYLPAVPIDPFSPQAAALRYVAAPGSEVIYSVGENGNDDGAATRPTMQNNSNRQLSTWEMMDAVVPFHPAPPRQRTTLPEDMSMGVGG